jgi:hypothetical protein
MEYPINRLDELRNKLESAGLKYDSRAYTAKRTEQTEEYVYEHLLCAHIEKYSNCFYVGIYQLEFAGNDKYHYILNKKDTKSNCYYYAVDEANDDNIDKLLGKQSEFIKELIAYRKKKSLEKDFCL